MSDAMVLTLPFFTSAHETEGNLSEQHCPENLPPPQTAKLSGGVVIYALHINLLRTPKEQKHL